MDFKEWFIVFAAGLGIIAIAWWIVFLIAVIFGGYPNEF